MIIKILIMVNGDPLTVSKKPLNNYNATIIYKYFTKEVSLISL